MKGWRGLCDPWRRGTATAHAEGCEAETDGCAKIDHPGGRRYQINTSGDEHKLGSCRDTRVILIVLEEDKNGAEAML